MNTLRILAAISRSLKALGVGTVELVRKLTFGVVRPRGKPLRVYFKSVLFLGAIWSVLGVVTITVRVAGASGAITALVGMVWLIWTVLFALSLIPIFIAFSAFEGKK